MEIAHNYSDVSKYLTLSIGVAGAKPSNPGKADDLLKMADAAMYRAKNSERNRVCPHDKDCAG